MKLTESMILNKSKAESLHDVRSLNMWGADLTDVSSCFHLFAGKTGFDLILL